MVPASFLPSKRKGGFQRKLSFERCLTKKQTKYIYDKVETGQEVRIRKLAHQNNADSAKQGTSVNNINQYEKALLSNKSKRRSNAQM